MKSPIFRSIAAVAALSLTGCGTTDAEVGNPTTAQDSSGAALSGPGALATDARVPELGDDLSILSQSAVSLADGVSVAAQTGPVIEAKFELGDDGKLSLSLYPAGKSLDFDAERNVFQELSGDPTAAAFQGSLEVFSDREHLLRSSRDLTLLQLSARSLSSIITQASASGTVFWAIPTIRSGRAGFGVYTYNNGRKSWHFYDGRGSREITWYPCDMGQGPGDEATDARAPELGDDLSILKQAKISLADAVAQVEKSTGPVIEAKFELGDDGKLSLSVYPVGKGLDMDAERNTFFEASGDPTQDSWTPGLDTFDVPDFEHLTRSARDLTLVQTASLSMREAIDMVQQAMPDGFVFWAIPTVRDTRPGYGIYVYGADGQRHYFFIS
jgi:hypothetical protein